MSDFIRLFKKKGNLSFIGMRETAESLLPVERVERDKLYHDLDRSKGILDDEPIAGGKSQQVLWGDDTFP